jgi:hypothetical protein
MALRTAGDAIAAAVEVYCKVLEDGRLRCKWFTMSPD